jgi:hypothetical protein
LRQGVFEASARTIHFVDEHYAGNSMSRGLTPYSLGLGLHAGNAAENNNGAIQHTKGPLDLNREVNMPGSVNDVYLML